MSNDNSDIHRIISAEMSEGLNINITDGLVYLNEHIKSKFFSVFKHKDYTFLWCGQLISNIGDSFSNLALAWLIKILTGSTVLMGTAFAASAASAFIFGIVSGVIVDRVDKRLALMISDGIRAFIVALFVLSYSEHVLHPWMIILFSIIMGGASSVFNPARQSILARIVDSSEITQANSFAMITRQVSTFIGPILAGISVSDWGVAPAFWIDTISFVVSVFSITLMHRHPVNASGLNVYSFFKEMKEGFSAITSHSLLKWVLILAIIGNFAYGPVPILLPFYANNFSVHGAAALGYIEGTMGVGMLLGSVFSGIFGSKLKKGLVSIVAMWGMGLSFLLAAYANGMMIATVAFGLFGLFNMLINISIFSMFQQETPSHLQGRVFSILFTTLGAALPISQALGGSIGQYATVAQVYGAVGCIFLALAVWVSFLRPVRQVH